MDLYFYAFLTAAMMYCNIYIATLTPWTDHFRCRSDDQCKGRLLFLCIASVQQLGPAPFRAPASSIVTPDNYSSCPARAPGQKNAAMYVHKTCARSKISKSLHQHWLRSRSPTVISYKNGTGAIKRKMELLLLSFQFPSWSLEGAQPSSKRECATMHSWRNLQLNIDCNCFCGSF